MSTKLEPSGRYIANVHASKLLCSIIVLATLTGILSLCFLAEVFFWAILLIPIALWQGYSLLRQEGLRTSQKAIVIIEQHKNALWRLIQKDGTEIMGRESESAVRSPYITILSLQTLPANKMLRVVLPFDAMSKEQYQLLTSRLWK